MRPESPEAGKRDPRHAVLAAGLRELALTADDALVTRLLAFADLLTKWNHIYNLSAVRDPMQIVRLHLLDCLAALPAVDRHLQGRPAQVLDVGSGGGLPGVVWAIMRPLWIVRCVDSVSKKISFVRQAGSELGLGNLQADQARVERLPQRSHDLVVSRAFASLRDFTRLTRAQLAPHGCWVALKGKVPGDEIGELDSTIDVFHVEPLQVPGLTAERCLVWMRPVGSARSSGPSA